MKNNPRVLVAVPTYGRPQFLPRIIANFDRLQYDNKKLVIINDDIKTKYSFNPDSFSNTWNNINIINLENKTPLSISKKRNMFLDWDWDVLFFLDDDDVLLPDRISNHIEIYNSTPDIDVVKNTSFFITYDGALDLKTSLCTMNFSITKKGVQKAGYFNEDILGAGEDTDWWHRIHNNCNVHYYNDPKSADFVYWFSGSNYHASVHCEENTEVLQEMVKSYLTNNNYEKNINLYPDYESYDSIVSLCREVRQTNKKAHYIWLNDKCTGIIKKHDTLDIKKILSNSRERIEQPIQSLEDGICKINDTIHAQQHPGSFYALNNFFNQNKFECLIEIGTGSGGLTEFLCNILPETEIHSFDSYPPEYKYKQEKFCKKRFSQYSNLFYYNMNCFDKNTIDNKRFIDQ